MHADLTPRRVLLFVRRWLLLLILGPLLGGLAAYLVLREIPFAAPNRGRSA